MPCGSANSRVTAEQRAPVIQIRTGCILGALVNPASESVENRIPAHNEQGDIRCSECCASEFDSLQ